MFKQIIGALLCTAVTVASGALLVGLGLELISNGAAMVVAAALTVAMVVGMQRLGE